MPAFKLAPLTMLTVLAACGGGGGNSAPAVATSAGTTVQAGGVTIDTPSPSPSPSSADSASSTGQPVVDVRPAEQTGGIPDNAAPVIPSPPKAGLQPRPPEILASGGGSSAKPGTSQIPGAEQQNQNDGAFAAAGQGDRGTRGDWSAKINWPVVSIHAALTADGRVLTYGTDYNVKQDSQFRYDVWDPSMGMDDASHLLLLNSTKTFLFCSAQILLQNGQMLILGGDLLKDGRVTNRGVKDANLFDPTNNQLTPARNEMTLPRWYGTATTLPTGEVYIQGGTDGERHPEIRKADGSFKALTIDTEAKRKVNDSDMAIFENDYPRNFVGPNGKVFGFDPHFMYEIDPYANRGEGSVKIFGAHWDFPRVDESGKEDWSYYRWWMATSTTAMVGPGLILQFGGGDPEGRPGKENASRLTLIDINGEKPKLIDVASMDKVYHWSNATIMADGKVLISGGSTKNLLLDAEEPINEDAGEINYDSMIFNPKTRDITPGARMSVPRLYHSVTLLLPDATVLSTGGGQPGPVDNLNAQIYRPPYLFNKDGSLAKRPVLKGEVGSGAVALVADPASVIHIETDDANDIDKVTLIKTGAVTHSFDMEQRYNDVSFRVNGKGLDIELPKNKFLTPPGYYHVFAFNKAGVPSRSRMVRINPSEKAPI